MLSVIDIFKKIDNLTDEFIYIWQDICNIESPSNYKLGVDRVGDYFVDFANKLGWRVEKCQFETCGDCICITMNPNLDKSAIALSGHIDTVHPIGIFGQPAVKIENDKIFGPGVADCKGGVVAALLAMTALSQLGFSERPIKLLLQSDEETSNRLSNKKAIEYICRMANDCKAFINCESTSDDKAVIARKGVARYEFEIKGKSIHSAYCQNGVSAITEAAYKIIELEKMKDEGSVTCNCGLVKGGTAENIVPDGCTFTAEIRFYKNSDFIKAKGVLDSVANNSYVRGTTCVVKEISVRPAMEEVERNFNLLEKINGIFYKNGLTKLKPYKSSGGSDAAEVTISGIPCIDSLGVKGGEFHTLNEYAIVSSLPDAAKRLALVCAFL